MVEEVWKKIEGYEDYSISNYGNVWSQKTKKGRYLKPSPSQGQKKGVKYNYHSYWVNLTKDGKSNMIKVSRLVATAFIPNPNNYPIVHHKDCDPSNNHIDNLEWTTHLENTQSVNTLREIGGVKVTKTGFAASFIYYGKTYDFYNPDKDKCQDWLNARRVELKNNLNLTELDCHNKYKGYIFEYSSGSFQARIEYKTNSYSFNNPNREKCQDWLNARHVEIMNGLNLTEIDVRKKGKGSIFLTKSKTFSAEIMIKGKLFRKTFKTREEGERYIEECKRNNA